jgi:glycine betaine/proline transport system ATP-binding protein
MTKASITCRNITKAFGPNEKTVPPLLAAGTSNAEIKDRTGHVVAVRDVSFEVPVGRSFVIMGLSGSGKSTLIRCISRLIEATSGSVLIGGDDILKMDKEALINLRRRRLSMVFQHFGLFPHRRVIDNVAYPLEIQGISAEERHKIAYEKINLVGLDGWANRFPHELSGGMQQRVGLARALATDPGIMLFDEPFSALDPLIRRELQDELLHLQARLHKTIIFITHDLTEAVRMGDRIAIMKDGAFVQVGAPEDIILRPANDYVRKFTEQVPRGMVLSARSLMRPAADLPTDPTGCFTGARSLSPDDRLDSFLHEFADDPAPIAVLDADRHPVGAVHLSDVLRAIGGRA